MTTRYPPPTKNKTKQKKKKTDNKQNTLLISWKKARPPKHELQDNKKNAL